MKKTVRYAFGYLLAVILAVFLFHHPPFNEIPPWEMWFDGLGLFWGMAFLVTLSLVVIIALPAVIAGFLHPMDARSGLLLCFSISFAGIFLFYLLSEGGPDFSFQIVVTLLTAIGSLFPFAFGLYLHSLTRKHLTRRLS